MQYFRAVESQNGPGVIILVSGIPRILVRGKAIVTTQL